MAASIGGPEVASDTVRAKRLIRLADALRLTRWPDGGLRIPILLYHRVTRPADRIALADPAVAVTQPRLDEQLGYLVEAGYTCIALDCLIAHVRDRRPVPQRSFVITFDDGFLDTYRLAWPVLERHGMTATVFLVSDMVGKSSAWARAEASGPQLLMGPDHVRRMQTKGIDFGSHGRTHARLVDLDDEALNDELSRSRDDLTNLLGREVTTLSYPFGRFDDRVRDAAGRAGYTASVSVRPGLNHAATDPLALRRIVVSGRDSGADLLVKMVLGEHVLRWHRVGAHLCRTAWRRIGRGAA